MDWSNERYVRLYTRDTKTWKLIGWEGQAVWSLTLRKLDRAGVLDDVHNAEDLTVMIGVPLEIVEVGLSRLLRYGVLIDSSKGLVSPNFIEAQEAAQTDKQRAKEARARKRDRLLSPWSATESVTKCDDTDVTKCDAIVTRRHSASHGVTARHSVPSLAVPSHKDPDPSDQVSNSGSGSSGSLFADPDPDLPVRSGSREPERVVFDHWARTFHPKSKLDRKRSSRIRARLREGFSTEQLCDAVDGAKHDPWLMGEDPKSPRRYDDLETILRDAAQVERLIELKRSGPHAPSGNGRRGTRTDAMLARLEAEIAAEKSKEADNVPY